MFLVWENKYKINGTNETSGGGVDSLLIFLEMIVKAKKQGETDEKLTGGTCPANRVDKDSTVYIQ